MLSASTRFVGREEELRAMEELYAAEGFQMLVLYGRRRVGKTMLVEQFIQKKKSLMFTAQLQADADNLADFSQTVFAQFDMPASTPSFATWKSAFSFVAERAGDRRLVVVFDEFPYACRVNPALSSTLQVAIDGQLKDTNIMLVLCGSNQGFMEQEVLGEKSPLYGRRTAQLKLRPFDFFDAVKMMPHVSAAEQFSYYASLGGTPYYLAGIDYTKSYVENMVALYFSRTGRMFDEPAMFMRQELREPAVFNSVLRAIANGANKRQEIADRIGVPSQTIGFYLDTLVSLDVVDRAVPFGEDERSRRAIYRVKDPAFSFWYRFVAPYMSAIENGTGARTAERLLEGERRTEYEGHQFEAVCRQWVARQAREGRLPIEVTEISSWWGTDPVAREQVDIDVVAADEIEKTLVVGECKWRNQVDASAAARVLRGRSALIRGYDVRGCYLFTKSRLDLAVAERLGEGVHVVSVGEML